MSVVALRKESVDRNSYYVSVWKWDIVALRKESVDRNLKVHPNTIIALVALRKESVDRNTVGVGALDSNMKSLSARRAWIEIVSLLCLAPLPWSLSARRAWIEIKRLPSSSGIHTVALRKESVDRNCGEVHRLPLDLWSLSARRAWIEIGLQWRSADHRPGRSPQGERG